ncbi:DUF819 family protein [Sinomicrobium soli]|uniref:DUF819 family protein n=1 Tax=Sinomicrobium sp. N-1-3-6 TaxID=2219864 RepID=UPI000DCEB61C|nr:DUF819 family protein [Sinomicrobium sp. N-1-3-6]RAV28880.1 hypothetical protein DN748_10790 [Sinomicrobium sp. N-1-3-6]
MNRRLLNPIGSICSLVLLVFACTPAPKEKPAAATTAYEQQLDRFFTTLYNQKMFNGAVAVKKEGKLIFKKGYGFANLKQQTPFTPGTAMEIASVSKQFTAAAVMLLQQRQLLDINQPVQAYLGEDFPYPGITVRHLLTHTSGLPDYEPYFRQHWDTTRIAYNADITAYFSTQKPHLESTPGTRYHYSNSGYMFLAEVVHRVSGQPLDQFLREHVFERTGMDSSGFYERDSIWHLDHYAPGYRLDTENCSLVNPETLPGKFYYHFLSGRLGPGRLSSSVDDLIRWDSILYTDKLLNAESKALAFTPHPPSGDDSDYGFGWHVQENDSLGKIVYHTGSWAGNLSYIKRFTASRSLVVLLNNTHETAYMKAVRTALDRFVSGSPLVLPRPEISDLLQKEICTLNSDNITGWANRHRDAEWDMEALSALEKKYRDKGETSKADLVKQLLQHREEASSPLITNDAVTFGLLVIALGLIFVTSSSANPYLKRFYRIIPSVLLCYFIPALMNTFGLIDGSHSSLYFVASRYLLPASLVLLTISINFGELRKLGNKAIIMFLAGTAGIIIGAPLALFLTGSIFPDVLYSNGEEVWRGLTTVAGSWIGGGANQTAMYEIFGASSDLFAQMIAVDVLVANLWMGFLLYWSQRPQVIDQWLKADSRPIYELEKRLEHQQAGQWLPVTANRLMVLAAIAFGITGLAHFLADIIAPFFTKHYPQLEKYSLTSSFFWLIVLATTFGLVLSFTKVRQAERYGASRTGTVFLYILVATIGMHMDLGAVLDNPKFFLIGIVWILIHIVIMLTVARLIRAPFFFIAVGSQANIGGAASAPIVAAAFSPYLAPVGVLLAVLGYAVGTYGAYLCGIILSDIFGMM